MKLSPKGFTLVELMIVIAIIGILAAALFPSLTSYLARGRDTSRASGLKEISTAVAAYMVDQSNAPAIDNTNCAPKTALSATYLPKFPVDPVTTHDNCGAANLGQYGYGTGNLGNVPSATFSAVFENAKGGNTNTGVSVYQGSNILTIAEIDTMVKGSGSGYVIRN